MSKIIAFPPARQSAENEIGQVDGQPVYSLNDLAECAMDTTSPSNVALSAEKIKPTTADWTNQELASLYRAQRLLSLTGVSFDVDRGLSDEGEPWFIFLDETQQVLAHFCRIGGSYHLDSRAQTHLLTAPSLEALVGCFARRNEMLQMADSGESRVDVIDFSKAVRTGVLMHPSTSLAALIWSAYILADGLVLPAWSEDSDRPSLAGTDVNIDLVTNDVEGQLIAPIELLTEVSETTGLIYDAEAREANASAPVILFGCGASYVMNVIALGLTTLSASYGLSKLAMPVNLLLPESDDTVSAVSLAHRELTNEIYADYANFFVDLPSAVNLLSQVTFGKDQTTDELKAANLEAGDVNYTSIFLETLQSTTTVMQDSGIELLWKDQAPPVSQAGDVPSIATKAEETDAALDVGHLSKSLANQDFFSDLSEFNVVEVSEVIEMAQVLTSMALPVLGGSVLLEGTGADLTSERGTVLDPSLATVDPTITYALFDQDAHDFVVYLLHKEQDLQRTKYDGEVILVDVDALGGGGGAVYARSWSFDDGSVLSTIGLKSDFELFGLVV